MNKVLFVIAILQCIALVFLFILVQEINNQTKLIPDKVDMLVDASQDKPPINLECPKCPECKDYSPELAELKKMLKKKNRSGGYDYYYYYTGCR